MWLGGKTPGTYILYMRWVKSIEENMDSTAIPEVLIHDNILRISGKNETDEVTTVEVNLPEGVTAELSSVQCRVLRDLIAVQLTAKKST